MPEALEHVAGLQTTEVSGPLHDKGPNLSVIDAQPYHRPETHSGHSGSASRGGESTTISSKIPCSETCKINSGDQSLCTVPRKTSSAARDDAQRTTESHPRDHEISIQPTHVNNIPRPLLGPIDRIVALKNSHNTRRKVTGFARRFRPIDPHVTFLPDEKIAKLVTPKDVALELSRSRSNPLVTHAPEKFCKILAILYLLKSAKKLRQFVQRYVCDDDLPFDAIISTEPGRKCAVLRSRNRPDADVPFEEADDFAQQQWSALAFVFKALKPPGVPHYKIPSERILPFQSHRRLDRRGASGQVYKTRIHPDYHCWKSIAKSTEDRTQDVFAVKTLGSEDKRAFDQEVKILRKLSQGNHKHDYLITLLATYEKDGQYSLVFPFAKSDLFGFWQQNAQPPKTNAMANWLAKQCRGLAQGLQHIHHWETFSGSSLLSESEQARDPSTPMGKPPSSDEVGTIEHGPIHLIGRHGDVKPENILWYPDSQDPRSPEEYGTLKITDFGIAKFSKEYSSKGHMPNSPSYRSPEYELSQSYSPACDVWALGCVYLELTTWYCGGYEALKQSARDRLEPDAKLDDILSDTFFTIYESPEQPGVKLVKLKTSVEKLICKLMDDPTCKDFPHFQELLAIIRDCMLVVHPDAHDSTENLARQHSYPSNALSRRKSAGDVFRFIGGMSVFVDEPEGPTRQNTHNTLASEVNAFSAASEMIEAIPRLLDRN
ncbi:kinase-like domain-containing protein [Paraphoma chrysanthemicola]|nr:kinase-like domain-containing protein [Paraphoma chrysanthemicola]